MDERSESERGARRDALRSFLSYLSLSRSLCDARLSPSWLRFPHLLLSSSSSPPPPLSPPYTSSSAFASHLQLPPVVIDSAPSLLTSSSTAPPPSVPLLCQLSSSTSCCLFPLSVMSLLFFLCNAHWHSSQLSSFRRLFYPSRSFRPCFRSFSSCPFFSFFFHLLLSFITFSRLFHFPHSFSLFSSFPSQPFSALCTLPALLFLLLLSLPPLHMHSNALLSGQSSFRPSLLCLSLCVGRLAEAPS